MFSLSTAGVAAGLEGCGGGYRVDRAVSGLLLRTSDGLILLGGDTSSGVIPCKTVRGFDTMFVLTVYCDPTSFGSGPSGGTFENGSSIFPLFTIRKSRSTYAFRFFFQIGLLVT
jgi:hypothetical protein